MSIFIENPATKKSLNSRRLIQGVGINNAKYMVEYYNDMSVRMVCPYYRRWKSMIERCYSKKYQIRQPTYKGCSVCEEWLVFTNFKEWMMTQDWIGNQLDKDFIEINNKVYCEKLCVFIPSQLNSLLTDHAAKKGKWPTGVSYDKKSKKFKACLSRDGKLIHIGLFKTPEKARAKYVDEKSKYIIDSANKYMENERLYLSIIKVAETLRGSV